MVALLARPRGDVVAAIDLFCGGGGATTGSLKAGANVRLAANHSDLAIATHSANHPDVDHLQADLIEYDAARLPRATLLWASPSCKHHSPANAKKAYRNGAATLFEDPEEDVRYAGSERSRVTMMCPLRYAAKHRPEMVIVENVVEAACWGPNRDGSTFLWWLTEWTRLGYEFECVFQNAMFFGVPQSRDRMFVMLWRRGGRRPDLDYRPAGWCERCDKEVRAFQAFKPRQKKWPLPKWGKYGKQYTYRCPGCGHDVKPYTTPAAAAIDWSNLGKRIGDRAKPLAPATMDRIRRGLERFGGMPMVMLTRQARYGTDTSVFDPALTMTTREDRALVTPGCMLVKNNGGWENRAAGHAGDPFGALTTDPSVGLAMLQVLFRANTTPGGPHEPWSTMTTENLPGLATWSGMLVNVGGNTHEKPGQVRAWPVTDPAITMPATPQQALATWPVGAMWAKQNGAADDTAYHTVEDPFGAITTRDGGTVGVAFHHAAWVDPYISDATAVTEPVTTATTRSRHSLAVIPSHLIDVDDVGFRMVTWEEGRRIMAFPENYVFAHSDPDKKVSNRDRFALLGDAVCPPHAEWLVGQALATLNERAV